MQEICDHVLCCRDTHSSQWCTGDICIEPEVLSSAASFSAVSRKIELLSCFFSFPFLSELLQLSSLPFCNSGLILGLLQNSDHGGN